MAETTITIKVESPGTATPSEAGDAARMPAPGADPGAGPPAPTLLVGPGEDTAETRDPGAAPPPMELSELGIGDAAETAAEGTGPPPEDLVEGGGSDEANSPEPMAIEDLDEKPKGKLSGSKKD